MPNCNEVTEVRPKFLSSIYLKWNIILFSGLQGFPELLSPSTTQTTVIAEDFKFFWYKSEKPHRRTSEGMLR